MMVKMWSWVVRPFDTCFGALLLSIRPGQGYSSYAELLRMNPSILGLGSG
jgi:hypothetical protein